MIGPEASSSAASFSSGAASGAAALRRTGRFWSRYSSSVSVRLCKRCQRAATSTPAATGWLLNQATRLSWERSGSRSTTS
jgi:hypothetical protein